MQNRHNGEDRKTSHPPGVSEKDLSLMIISMPGTAAPLLNSRQGHEGPALYRGGAERISPFLRRMYDLLSLEALWQGTEEGREVQEQKRALLLGILDFEIFHGSGDVKSTFLMRNEGREVLTGHFAAICLELGKVSWKEQRSWRQWIVPL